MITVVPAAISIPDTCCAITHKQTREEIQYSFRLQEQGHAQGKYEIKVKAQSTKQHSQKRAMNFGFEISAQGHFLG